MNDINSAPVEEMPKADLPRKPGNQSSKPWGLIVIAAILIIGLIAGLVSLTRADTQEVAKVRDLFIILMALVSLLIGAALVILIIQIAALTNLIQNEVKPILKATSQTVNTLKGTTIFLSDNLVEPVIKMNEYLAGLKQFFSMVKPGKK